ncbi:MAG: DUF222 domain-containing protein [Acidimicrobiia bacterium]
MEWETLSEDQLDILISECESGIARLRSMEMGVIAEKKRRQSHQADGYRSIIDWMAARADISHRTARRLCWTSTRLADAPEVASELVAGGISFDRAEQVARLPEHQRETHQHFDIAQLHHRVAHYRRLTPKRETETTSSYLHFQPSLDELTVNIWGELTGYDSRIVEKAIDQQADQIIPDTDQVRLSVAERRAAALITICNHSLYTDNTTDSDTDPDSDTDTDTDTDADADTDTDTDSGDTAGDSAHHHRHPAGRIDYHRRRPNRSIHQRGDRYRRPQRAPHRNQSPRSHPL